MQDPLDRLADARDGLDRVAQRFEKAQASLQEATGSDASGEVTVRLSPQDEVLDLVVGNRWKTAVGHEAFGAAVLEAYARAAATASEAWAETLASEVDGAEPATRPMAPTHESTYAQLDEVTRPEVLAARSEQSLAAMVEVLREANRQFDTVREQATRLAAAQHVGRSGGLSVTLSGGGTLAGVELEPDWAARTAGPALGQHFMKAYRDARREARSTTTGDLVDRSIFGELRRLAADPEALAARLRMT